MKRLLPCLAVAALLLVPGTAFGIAISNVSFDPSPTAAIQWNQDVNVSFDYSIDVPDGARVFVRPFSNGSLTPNYGASGSPIYPFGSGSGASVFRIQSGLVRIDEVRFTVYNAAQTELLLTFFVPVDYRVSGHAIYNIAMTPASPSCVMFNDQDVTIGFDYRANYAGNVLIFPRPMTNGSLTPGYSSSGSPEYPPGSGSGSDYFTITIPPEVTVDAIRFRMTNVDQSVVLLEFTVPCHYEFKAGSVCNITFDPPWPCARLHDELVYTYFNYHTDVPGGVRIFVLPYTNGAPTPNFGVSGSPLYPAGTGSGDGFFLVQSGEQTIDHIRYKMTTADQSQTLFEYFVPVNVHYAPHVVRGVLLQHDSPAYFTALHMDDTLMPYTHSQPGGALIWSQPYTGGGFTPNGGYEGSGVYPPGSGVADGGVTVMSGSGVVDQLRLSMRTADNTQQLMEWFVDAQLFFGSQGSTAGVDDAIAAEAFDRLFTLVPNPVREASAVQYRLPESADVRLQLFDIGGRRAGEVVKARQGAGEQTATLSLQGLSSGVYLLRLDAFGVQGSHRDQRKVIIVR